MFQNNDRALHEVDVTTRVYSYFGREITWKNSSKELNPRSKKSITM